MTKPIKHSNPTMALLLERVDYIEDPNDKKHIDKTLTVAKNYNCGDQSKEAFIRRTQEFDTAYFEYREGRKGPKADRLFREFTYSCEKGAFLTPDERDAIEKMLIAKFAGPNAAVRTAWHISPDGRADIHLLIAAKAPCVEDPDAYVYLFGKAIGNVIAACQATDRKIVRYLNANPDRRIEHTAAIDVYINNKNEKHKAKKRSLGHQIARKFPNLKVTIENIKKVLEDLGHEVLEVTARAVRLIFNFRNNESRLPLRNLLLSIGEAQVSLAREKGLGLQQEVPESVEALSNPASKSDTEFVKLLAFYEAATGSKIVTPGKLRELTESTKSMRTRYGKIKRAILETLTDDQKAVLAPLGKDYLKMNKH